MFSEVLRREYKSARFLNVIFSSSNIPTYLILGSTFNNTSQISSYETNYVSRLTCYKNMSYDNFKSVLF